MLFEMSFFADFKYWVREYDPATKKSRIHNFIAQNWECFEPDEQGEFSSVYNPDNFYRRVHGKSDFARNRQQPTSPVDLVIRDEYRNRYNHKPRIMYLDIETHVGTVADGFPVPNKALEPISLIQFRDSLTNTVHIIGDRDFYYKEHYLSLPNHLGAEVVYHKCDSEIAMFNKWFDFLEEHCPAVVYAWNGEGFDFPYLYNRAKKLGLNLNRFCPFWREFSGKTELTNARDNMFGDRYSMDLVVAGVHYIDIKRLYQKIVLAPRQSYALNAIATIELNAEKIEHTEFKTFEDFYLGNYTKPQNPTESQARTLCYQLASKNAPIEEIQKAGHGQFVYYGVIDVVLLKEIDEKIGLTALMASVTERMCSQYDSILRTTKPWANYIRCTLYDRNQIITDDVAVDLEKSIQGGFVRDPAKGKKKWVLSADVNSMYPILAIAGSNMSPETFVFARDLEVPELRDFVIKHLKVGTSEEQNESNLLEAMVDEKFATKLKILLQHANLAMAPNGTFYKKDQLGLVPSLVKEIYQDRKKAKRMMFSAEKELIRIEAEMSKRGIDTNN